MTDYILDTNAMTGLLNRDEPIKSRYMQATRQRHLFLACPVVYYEVKKGLFARDNKNKMRLFEEIYAGFRWHDYTKEDWLLAARLWANRKSIGRPIADADLFIAVFAISHHATLITNNTKDFDALGVTLADWSV